MPDNENPPPGPAPNPAPNQAPPVAPAPQPANVPPPSAAPAPAPAAAKTFTQDEVNRMLGERAQRAADGARAQFIGTFKDLGVNSADDLTTLVKSAHDAKLAQMTELQKAQERTKQLESDLAQARADANNRAEEARRARVFRENNVVPEYEDVLGVLLDRAKTDKPQDFDERAWLEGIKKLRPVLFAHPAPPTPAAPPPTPIGATTGVVFPQPPAAPQTQTPTPTFDASRATPEELRRWEQSLGIAVPSGGRI